MLTPGRAGALPRRARPARGPDGAGRLRFRAPRVLRTPRRDWLCVRPLPAGRLRRAARMARPPASAARARCAGDLSAAIHEAAPGRGGAIAAALVTGDRSAIDQRDQRSAARFRPRAFAVGVRHSHGRRRRAGVRGAALDALAHSADRAALSGEEDRRRRRAHRARRLPHHLGLKRAGAARRS